MKLAKKLGDAALLSEKNGFRFDDSWWPRVRDIILFVGVTESPLFQEELLKEKMADA
jgi:hypothetical protein